MADVFISYARADRGFAALLAKAVERRGLAVWWDRDIPVGQSFSEVIEKALDRAYCVVVLWSSASIDSEWVLNEAAEGARRKILVPVLIQDVRPPLEFRRLQTASLFDANALEGPEFEACIAAIRTRLQSDHAAIAGAPSEPHVAEPETAIAAVNPTPATATAPPAVAEATPEEAPIAEPKTEFDQSIASPNCGALNSFPLPSPTAAPPSESLQPEKAASLISPRMAASAALSAVVIVFLVVIAWRSYSRHEAPSTSASSTATRSASPEPLHAAALDTKPTETITTHTEELPAGTATFTTISAQSVPLDDIPFFNPSKFPLRSTKPGAKSADAATSTSAARAKDPERKKNSRYTVVVQYPDGSSAQAAARQCLDGLAARGFKTKKDTESSRSLRSRNVQILYTGDRAAAEKVGEVVRSALNNAGYRPSAITLEEWAGPVSTWTAGTAEITITVIF